MKAEEVLALVGGHVDDELLLRNEYLAAENEILRSKLPARVPMTDDERIRLAKLGKRLGKNALMDVAAIVAPETILSWYWRLVAKKYDGSANRGKIGRPRIDETLEKLILQIAVENRTWGYDRISGALSNLGYEVSDETVANVLRRNGVAPSGGRKPTLTWVSAPVRVDPRVGWHQNGAIAAEKPKFERIRGTICPIRQGGVSVQVRVLQRTRPAPRDGRISCPLSQGTKPPGERQRAPLPLQRARRNGTSQMSRTAWRPAQILLARGCLMGADGKPAPITMECGENTGDSPVRLF